MGSLDGGCITPLLSYPRAVRSIGGTIALLILVALLPGCGGSYTKSDFIARADAICTGAVRQTRSLAPPAAGGSGPQQLRALGRYLGKLLPVVQSEAAQVRGLKRPVGDPRDRAALQRYLGALEQAAGDYRELAAAAKRGDAQAVASAEGALRASPVGSLAAGYGLRVCGNAGSTGV
jgi:hypothetical protein